MDYSNFITKHNKNKHLQFSQRVLIEIRLRDKHSPYKIAKELGCSANTIRNEIKRGTVKQLKQNISTFTYYADAGQRVYDKNRKNSIAKYKRLKCSEFINYVTNSMIKSKWSVDACVGNAILNKTFKRSEMVCTKTIYNYIDLGLMSIKNVNLPNKLRINTKKSKVKNNKRKLGRSISQRPESINNRQEFGHWEIDTLLGAKSKEDNVLLTLVERKTRNVITKVLNNKTIKAVMSAINELRKEYNTKFSKVFKTITSDNGQEFAKLSTLEQITTTNIYYTHPYSSFERGTNERHNGLLRRFIYKGKSINSFSIDEISFVEDWCNNLPRKILGYKTPYQLFEEELDLIYAI